MESLVQHFEAAEITDSEDDCSSNDDIEGVSDGEEVDRGKLDITEALANLNYEAAGVEVEEEADKISIGDNKKLINVGVDSILDEVVTELKMPYSPSDFQRISINALGQQKSVILVSPTGSGKMNVPLLATLVIRRKFNIHKG